MTSLNKIEKNTLNLVNALQTISSEDETIFGFIRALKHSEHSSKFFTLLYDAVNPLRLKLRNSDLRVEASLNLLLQLSHNKPMIYNEDVVQTFSSSLCNNHPTLIQSFFRIVKNSVYVIENPSLYIGMSKKLTHSERAGQISIVTNELLNSLSELPIPAKGSDERIIKEINEISIAIPLV